MSSSFNDYRRDRKRFVFFPFIAVIIALGLGAVVMLLWNAILPDLLHVTRINYWQSVGLLVLCRILFGNFGRGGKPGGRGDMMRRRGQMMREKWIGMTPEERIKFKEEWKERCRNRGGRPNR